MGRTTDPTRYTLLTNIEFVQMVKPSTPLRFDAHAVLIEHGAVGFGEPYDAIRGFGVMAELPVFTYWLPKRDIPFNVRQEQQDNRYIVLDSEQPEESKPLFSGATLEFTSSMIEPDLTFFLQASDPNHEIDKHIQTGEPLELWKVLRKKVAQYWRYPNMPVSVLWGPPC